MGRGCRLGCGRVRFLFKLAVMVSLAVMLGMGSAVGALWLVTDRGAASATSENPYARAAHAVRHLLPNGAMQ